MTPAINCAKRAKIAFQTHTYVHDANTASYGLEAAEKLQVDVARVFKTLVVSLDTGRLAVGIVPVSSQLDLKMMAKACGVKRCQMADKSLVERSTGYVLGGVSPLGQKRALVTVLDVSASAHETLYVSAGKRGLEIELTPLDLAQLTRATNAEIARVTS